MTRVTAWEDVAAGGAERIDVQALVPPEPGSELALDALRLAPEASLDLTDPLHDTVLFTFEGSGALDGAAIAGGALRLSRIRSRPMEPRGATKIRARNERDEIRSPADR